MAQTEPAPPPPRVETPAPVKTPEPVPAKIKPVRQHKAHKPHRPQHSHQPQRSQQSDERRSQLAEPSAAPSVSEPAAPPPVANPVTSEAPAQTLIPPSSDSPRLRNPAPVYPAMSRKLREQGTVLLRLLVKANGQVESVSIKESSGFKRLDDTALRTVRRWHFVPATQAGLAVDYWYELPVEFSLK